MYVNIKFLPKVFNEVDTHILSRQLHNQKKLWITPYGVVEFAFFSSIHGSFDSFHYKKLCSYVAYFNTKTWHLHYDSGTSSEFRECGCQFSFDSYTGPKKGPKFWGGRHDAKCIIVLPPLFSKCHFAPLQKVLVKI